MFTPTLFVGAVVGCDRSAQSFARLWPASRRQAPFAYAMVGMGAFLAAATQAPLMAILMIFEMTLSYQALSLPLMLACLVAYLVVRLIGARSIYAAAEQRRQRDAERHDLTSRTVGKLLRPSPPTLGEDAPVATVVAAFAEFRFQYLYVVDAGGRYRGSVSLHDLRQRLEGSDEAARIGWTAASLTTATLQVLHDTMTLQEALETFRAHRGERLPVVDASQRLVGALWKTDVLLELQQRLGLAR